MSTFKDHFSGHAAVYAAYRPTYPDALSAWLASIAPGRGLALDCGCGNGQLSTMLADHFDRVEATDASTTQVASAKPHDRVAYRVAPAERSGLAADSVDLVTVAQAAHWFDLDLFYAEVRRVLRPGGVIALITYGNVEIGDDVGAVVDHFYSDILDRYWPPERCHVEAGYRSLSFPFDEIAAPAFAITLDWPLNALTGYVESWSATNALERDQGRELIDGFRSDLATAWGEPDAVRRMRWPLAIRVGRSGPIVEE